MKNKKVLINKLLPIAIIFLILLIFYGRVLVTPGDFLSGDLTFHTSLGKFILHNTFMWDDMIGSNTFDVLPRFMYNLPFIALGILFNLDMTSVVKLILFSTAIISMYSFFVFSKFLLKDLKFDDDVVLLTSILCSIIYGINIWTITRIAHIYLLPTYAIFPIIMLLLVKHYKCMENDDHGNKKGYIKKSLLIGMLIAFFGITPHGIIWILSIVISWLLFSSVFRTRYYLLYNIKFITLVVFIFLTIGSYFLVPVIISSTVGTISPYYVPTWDMFEIISRNSNLDNVVRLLSYWWPQANYAPDQGIVYNIWEVSSYLLPLLALFALILNRNIYSLYFSILASIFILLSLGTGTYISKLFYDIFSHFLGQFMWIFRDPAKNLNIVVFSYSVLAGMTISKILAGVNRGKPRFFTIFIFAMIYGLFIAPSVYNYNFGWYVPSKIPDAYSNLDLWEKNESGDFKVLWLSSWDYGTKINGVTRYSWDHNKSVSSRITVGSSEKPSFDTRRTENLNYYYTYLRHIISNDIDPKKYLSPISVKYIIYGNDGYGGEQKGFQDMTAIRKYLVDIVNYSFIYVFENPSFSPHINIVDNMIIIGGFDIFTSLNNIQSFNSTNSSLIFIDQKNMCNDDCVNDTNSLVMSSETIEPLQFFINDKYVITPFDATIRNSPSNVWSKARVTDVTHGEFHPYLDMYNIENWDFDYGKGLVFTWSSSIIDISSKPSEEDLLHTYNFENDFEGWDINEKDIQTMKLSNDSYSGKHSLQSILNESKWGWKTINSPLILAYYDTPYRWIFHIKGENSYETHAKIVEFDSKENIINTEYMTDIGNGAFDWKDISFDYKPSNNNTKYIQLQIWYGHKTDQPLPNKISIDDVKIYDMTKYVKPVSLDMNVNINNDDDYELFIRYFKNEEGSRINISLDGKLINSVNTYDQLDKFEWKKIDTLKLKKGKYKLTLTNVKGFNAVNIFALVPKKEYEDMQKRTDSLLEGKRLIYIFEAESDLYRNNASTSNKYGGNASNGDVLEFNETSAAWQTIDILRSDNYKMALKINGSFDVKIDDMIYNTSSNMSDFVYIGPLYLNKGSHKIEIQGDNSDLDVIWLYSVNSVSKKIESNIILNTTIPIVKPTGREIAFKTDKYRGFISINQPPGNVIEINEGDNVTWFNEETIPVTFFSDIPGFGVKFLDYGKRTSYMFTRQGQYHFYFKENKNFNVTVVVKSLNKTSDNDKNINSFNDTSEKLEDIFAVKEIPATVTNYTKINPTLYNIKINATKPFMLSFAESYDPLWTARVDKINGKSVKSEIVRPVSLYSVVNGFWINQTGELDIIIEYEPQRWFYIGAAISITTLIICIGYLIYDWRRKRNE